MEEEQRYYMDHNNYAPILTRLKSGFFCNNMSAYDVFISYSCITQGFSFEMKRRE